MLYEYSRVEGIIEAKLKMDVTNLSDWLASNGFSSVRHATIGTANSLVQASIHGTDPVFDNLSYVSASVISYNGATMCAVLCRSFADHLHWLRFLTDLAVHKQEARGKAKQVEVRT